MYRDPFKEYLKETEQNKVNKRYIWGTAIGLQAVDGLKPSQYLIDTAISNIEGDITLEEERHLIESYYESNSVYVNIDDRIEEADRVSLRSVKYYPRQLLHLHPMSIYLSIVNYFKIYIVTQER